MKRILLGLVPLLLVMSACGDDRKDGGKDVDGTVWISTVDPRSGVKLSCFVVDGFEAMAMHCVEVP